MQFAEYFWWHEKRLKVWLPLKACVQYGFSTQWHRCALNLDQITFCVIKWSEVSTDSQWHHRFVDSVANRPGVTEKVLGTASETLSPWAVPLFLHCFPVNLAYQHWRAMLSSALRAVYSICCLQPRMLNIQIQGLVELAQESYGNTHTHTHTLCSMLATTQLATLLGICSRRSRPHFIVENLFYS